jgi:hypothetical protein
MQRLARENYIAIDGQMFHGGGQHLPFIATKPVVVEKFSLAAIVGGAPG